MVDTVTLRAECHCGYASYSYLLPKSAFPLQSAICHCQTCRHVSGQIFATHASMPFEKRPDVTKLTSYASNGSGSLTRHSCPKCGARIINFENDGWGFATGVLSIEGKPEAGALTGLLDRVQLCVSDTVDGGGSIWMSGDWEGKRYMHNKASDAVSDQMLRDMACKAKDTTLPTDDVLRAGCHCGSIQMTIARSDNGAKYGAGIDACSSCRKVTGFEITSWVTLDPAKVDINGNGLDLGTPKLSHYTTSPDVHRYFCAMCGSTIFYLKDGKVKNPGIDLAAGLIYSAAGVRAEDWLDWGKYDNCVEYAEDASDEQFVRSLLHGVENDRHVR